MLHCTLALSFCITSLLSSTPDVSALRRLGDVTETRGVITAFRGDVSKFSAADYRLLGSFTSLKKLTIDGKSLTDETLPLLAGLTNLEEFSTNQSQLTDEGYRHFAPLVNLRVLSLWHPSWNNPGFTGSGLSHLQALPRLERLTFAGSTAGDTALEAVGQLKQLREFHTWHTRQTQAGNQHLTALPQLRALRIGQRLPAGGKAPPPSFDAATIRTISTIRSLERLELFEGVFAAGDLQPLAALTSLRQLKIHTSEVPEAEIDTLRQALPKASIDYQPITAEDREATLKKKLRLID